MPERSALVGEFIGTFALVFFGGAALVAESVTGGLGPLGVAVSFGLVIGIGVYAFGAVSGAHFNPAVTVALWASGRFRPRSVLPYVVIQLIAAAFAAALLHVLVSTAGGNAGLASTLPGTAGTGAALAAEIAASFLLVTVILRVVAAGPDARAFSGLAIGGTIALCALSVGWVSGASMNPARSFGPALFSPAALRVLWIYVLGPLTGAGLAALADRLLTSRRATGLTAET